MNKTILLHKDSIYRSNNFIDVGNFKGYSLKMGIDKLSFISYVDSEIEREDVYEKLNFLCKEKAHSYKIEKFKPQKRELYKENIKITSIECPEFYMIISYMFTHKKDNGGIRFELSPQYGELNSIYNIVEWLKDVIGEDTVRKLFINSKITRIDITVDVLSNKFISNYYFSIPKSRKGIRFIHNKDSCKNNYAVGSYRSEFYLLVYEKTKLFEECDLGNQTLLTVKEKNIEKRITRLELRIRPKKELLLSSLSTLKNPFSNVDIYSKSRIKSIFCDFMPFLEHEKSLPIAINSYLESVNGSSRYNRYKINEMLARCKSKHILDIDWDKWKDIVRFLDPLTKLF